MGFDHGYDKKYCDFAIAIHPSDSYASLSANVSGGARTYGMDRRELAGDEFHRGRHDTR
jgi:hypothetical protein